MDLNAVLRSIVLVFSVAVMLLGVLVMAGILVPRYFPAEYRLMMGLVVFLYGLYRFVLTFYRQRRREE